MLSYLQNGTIINRRCIKTIKDCSLDTSNGKKYYLVSQNEQVVDFDEIKRLFCNNFLQVTENAMKSVDCYFELQNNHAYIVEFKNRKISTKLENDLKLKLKDTLLILNQNFQKDMLYFKDRLNYIVVYSYEKNEIKNRNFKEKIFKKASKS